jgi:toxin HigB-1
MGVAAFCAGAAAGAICPSVMLDVTRTFCYAPSVIGSFRDKRTRDFAAGKRVKAFAAIERSARLKLDRLDAATSLRDLAVLPGNRFEPLLGERRGQYSIRINDQWRICFEWPGRALGPLNVEIVDYH